MLRLLLIPLLCLALAGAALAEDDYYLPFEEDAYTSEYFGTTLIVFSTERLDYPEDSWWTDALPEEMMMDQAYLVGMVNGARSAAGKPKLDPDGWYINFGYESDPGIEEQPIRQWQVHVMWKADHNINRDWGKSENTAQQQDLRCTRDG